MEPTVTGETLTDFPVPLLPEPQQRAALAARGKAIGLALALILAAALSSNGLGLMRL
jgi:hypothetical protein